MLNALAAGWAPTFSAKPFSEDLARNFLDGYASEVSWDWTLSCPPSLQAHEKWLKVAKQSSPGWDGITNAAWRAAGPLAADVLYRQTISQLEGNQPGPGFNVMVWHFPPKKAVEGDLPGVDVRLPKATRPIACKTCDNKATAAVVCHGISEMTQKQTSQLQRDLFPTANFPKTFWRLIRWLVCMRYDAWIPGTRRP